MTLIIGMKTRNGLIVASDGLAFKNQRGHTYIYEITSTGTMKLE